MYNQRQNIDLDSLLDKGSALARPRAPTPIRKAPIKPNNKENLINPANQWNNMLNINNMGYEQKQPYMPENAIKKPLISPVRNPFKTQIEHIYEQQRRGNRHMGNMLTRQKSQGSTNNCANHPNKPAQFNIQIDQQYLTYCSRCAAQLASQGFEVIRLDPATVKKGQSRSPIKQGPNNYAQFPHLAEYQQNPKYKQIIEFLSQLSQVEKHHLLNMDKLGKIDSNYSEQIEQTKQFYTQLISFIQQMRDDHLNDLFEESRRHSQIADIQHDYLRENVDQMHNIRRDIEENLEIIVEKLDQDDLRNNLDYYKHKIQVYEHKVEEQAEFFSKIISFMPEEYNSKLGRVQDFLMQVWNTQSQSTIQQPEPQHFVQKFFPSQPRQLPQHSQVSQKASQMPMQHIPVQPMNAMHSMPMQMQMQKPQTNSNFVPPIQRKSSNIPVVEDESKSTAFRKLFEEEEQVMAETSPQFKKI